MEKTSGPAASPLLVLLAQRTRDELRMRGRPAGLVAAHAGVSPSTLYKVLRAGNLRLGTLDRIAHMLEVEPHDLLRIKSSSQPQRLRKTRTPSQLPSQVRLSIRVRQWLAQEGKSVRSLSSAAEIPLTTMYRIIDRTTDVNISTLVPLAGPFCLHCAPWELISPLRR